MKTVLIFAGLVAFCLAGAVPPATYGHVHTKPVDADFVARQKKVLSLFHNAHQVDFEADYYKIGTEYNVEANIANYKDEKIVQEFLALYRTGFLPKGKVFSVYYERMRDEAIALFKLFYAAKDFETFYKTAAFARVNFNEGQFYYALYITIYQREDTQGLVIPAPYEVFPEMFTNYEALFKAYRVKMQDGPINTKLAETNGVIKENDYYVIYANYSNYWTYDSEEQRLNYFTEDIGLNAFYYYFQTYFPFWLEGDQYGVLKEHRGEIFFYFYQQLLARYYLQRLTHGLGEIPDFSWYEPIETAYAPFLSTGGFPFIQRNQYYNLNTPVNNENIQFLDAYEKTFLQYLQRGHFKAYNQEVDFRSSKAVNFVGNFWQSNADLYEKSGPRNYERSYEIIARHVLGATPEPLDKYTIAPSALNLLSTSVRDPAFYQLYSKIMKYFLKYKEYLEPYTQEKLHYVGVKINDVKVDKLVTFFDLFDYDMSNAIFDSKDEIKGGHTPVYKIRQPRLDHKPFNVEIDVKADSETEAVFKIFLGPKYNSRGYPLTMEENWMNFVELDSFVYKLKAGVNKVERSSEEFFYTKEDSIPTFEVLKMIEQGKVPVHMSNHFEALPKRLMLPKGTFGGYPFQLFVFVYPYQAVSKDYEHYKFLVDNKPFGFPLDRPVNETFFRQPNMFFEEVEIYHEGENFAYTLGNPFYVENKNQVPKN